MACKPHPERPAAATVRPLFFATRHDDRFWRRQAELLEPVWRSGRIGPDLGIIWEHGRITGGRGWVDLLPGFDEEIACDPEHPDDELRGLLGERLTDLRHVCEHLRFKCFTTTQIRNSFLISVLCETEVRT